MSITDDSNESKMNLSFSILPAFIKATYNDYFSTLSIESDGQLRTSLYDKRDDFNFQITNFSFLSSNIPSSPAYGVLSHSSYGMPGLAPLINVLF